MESIPLIIDTDPAMGLVGRDVDDGLALMMALASPKIKLLGVTISHGNASMTQCLRVGRSLLRRLGRADIDIYPGASGPGELGGETRASRFIIDTLRQNPGVVILAIAPLTNVATAFMLAPDLISDIKRIVIMGGAFRVPGNVPPMFKSEFNFWRDPEAARRITHGGASIRIVPLDVTEKVIFTDDDLEQIKRIDTKISRFFVRAVSPWLFMNKLALRKGGFYLHDPLALGALINPRLVKFETVPIEVTGSGPLTGGKAGIRNTSGPPEAEVALDVNVQGFKSLALALLKKACELDSDKGAKSL